MDENIDLANIQSIPHHEMLAITNQYMIGCADHINKYVYYYVGWLILPKSK